MKKQVIGVAVLATLMGVGGVLGMTTTTAQAKTQMTLRTIPQRYRHTWYHYSQGKYERLTFSTKKIAGLRYFDGQSTQYRANLHAHKLTTTKFKRHMTWSSATTTERRHATWINVRGWNQGMGAGDYYKVMTKSYQGDRHAVLSQAGGAGVWTSAHYYRSKKIAKQLKNHHFKGEIYY
ncbi:hypothetical protein [Levilactobacillus tongjiangensis]|uniref:Uncharacterized protein n=1 Tax=Levilactobacillus tongjiangensis TaxID=2486023 RepID=A0ABW1SPG7_9LACO|nr:hypothetical protein [Levilactobacillus tongjiangensis]